MYGPQRFDIHAILYNQGNNSSRPTTTPRGDTFRSLNMGKGLKFLGQSEYDDKYQSSSLSIKDENRVNYSDVVTALKNRDVKGNDAVFLTERLPPPPHHHGHGHGHQSREASSSDQASSHEHQTMIVKEQARKSTMTKAIPPQMHFSTETGDKYTWPSEKKQQQQQQMPSKSPSIELNKSRVLIGNHHPIVTTTATTTVKEKRKKALTGNSYSTTGSTGRSPYGYFNSSSSTSELQSESRSKYLWPKSKLDVGKASSRRTPSHHPHQPQQQHPHHNPHQSTSSSPQLDLISTSATTINRNVSDNRTTAAAAAAFRQPSYSFPSNGSQDSSSSSTTGMTTDSLAVVIPTVAPSSESIDDSTIVAVSHPHPRPAANDDVTMNSTSSYSLNGGELRYDKSLPTFLHTTSIHYFYHY